MYLYATVLEILPDPSARTVQQLNLGTLDGKRFTARAKYYVLAAGGIENPRLLLLSRSVQREGLGNQNDLVGRFFSNHRGAHWAKLYPSAPDADPRFYLPRFHKAGLVHPTLSLSEKLQTHHRLPNLRFNVTLPAKDPKPGQRSQRRAAYRLRQAAAQLETSDFDRTIARVITDVDSMTRSASPPASESTSPSPFLVRAICESIPHADSRVQLGRALDSFGQPRVVLDWRIAEDEERSILRGFLVLGTQFGASGIGRLQIPEQHLAFSQRSYHHMGTTRMHSDPKHGVVDANCRVHGIDNLFAAGSSVFPSYGAAEPTYTIIALAFRLSDHLKGLVHGA